MLHQGDSESGQSGRTVSHYRILDQIGRGGMGQVYRARDDRLDRDVAIKVLPPSLTTDHVASRRFIREARVASRLVHPYVATVFDVLEDGDELFLVMELIEGQRLSTLLREESPPPAERLRWSLEIAEALASIHRIGLVHRDIKPGNVMITPDRHVKLMDFGLARQSAEAPTETVEVTQESVVTREGVGVGTLLYMSPEQLRGQPLDQRSDLFSFGVLLYEMITGLHPFKRATGPDSMSAILHDPPGGGHEPDSLTDTGPTRDLVLKLLEKEPDKRFQTCDEVVGRLQTVMRSQPSAPVPVVPSSRRSRFRLALAAAVIVGIAAAGYGIREWLVRPPPPDLPRVSMALVPFADRTGESNGQELASMVTDFLSIELGASRLVRSVGPRQTVPLMGALTPESDAVAIADRVVRGLSVDYVLTGTLYREGDRYLTSVEFNPSGEEIPPIPQIRGEGATVIELVENLSATLRRKLPDISRLNAWRDDPTALAKLTSDSNVATLQYGKGLIAMREARFGEASGHFEKAVEADPGFALAHARLGETLHAVGYGRRAREAVAKAVELAPERGSLAQQRIGLLVRAMRAEIYSRTGERVELTDSLVALFPDDPELLRMSAAALVRSGEYGRGQERIDRAVKLDPINPFLQLERARLRFASGLVPEGLEALDDAEELFRTIESEEGLARVAFLRGQAFITREQFVDAARELDRAHETLERIGSDVLAANVLRRRADIELLRGNAKAADGLLVAAASAAREAGQLGLESRVLSTRGAQRFVAGDHEAAEVALREAVDKARQLENEKLLINPLSNLGSLLSYTGRREEARVELISALEVAQKRLFKKTELKCLRLLGDIDYQSGDLDAALQSFEKLMGEERDDRPSREAAWNRLYVAELHERRGTLSAALEATQNAVEIARELSLNDALGYALVRQSLVMSALGRTDAALAALDEACSIASSPNAGLEGLAAQCLVARGVSHARQGDWKTAVREAEQAIAHPGASVPAVLVAARSVACEGLIEIGAIDRAVERCDAASGGDAAPLPDRVIARALLSEVRLREGRRDQALEEARAAFDQAERMGLLLPLARSAGVLAQLVPEDQRPSIRDKGREAIDEYVRSAPPEDRERILSRPDLMHLETRLGDVPERSGPAAGS